VSFVGGSTNHRTPAVRPIAIDGLSLLTYDPNAIWSRTRNPGQVLSWSTPERLEWPPMSEPNRAGSDVAASSIRSERALPRPIALLLEIALALRVLTALAVEWYVQRQGASRLCLFEDSKIYWALARTIRLGAPYEVLSYSDIPHGALRTPGYPLFLACSQAVFGERTLPVRLLQGALGTLGVYLVYRLSCKIGHADARFARAHTGLGDSECTAQTHPQRSAVRRGRLTPPLLAAGLVALHPFDMFTSALVLSEAVFQPLMLATLLGLAALWWDRSLKPGAAALVALGTGVAAGAAILVRPSWALFVPLVLTLWVGSQARGRRLPITAAQRAAVCALGVALVMAPWWARNFRLYGGFLPTALWLGASLYDGLNERATGASDMTFLADDTIWPLDEQDQDAELTRRALAFTRDHPWQAGRLAVIKLGRFWSPWPNAAGFRTIGLAIACALMELPLFGLMALGAWSRRDDPRTWFVVAGPLLYFCALHLVFASSMRYRIPGEMPALSLAAFGWTNLTARRHASDPL
jgi:hypothetical protein